MVAGATPNNAFFRYDSDRPRSTDSFDDAGRRGDRGEDRGAAERVAGVIQEWAGAALCARSRRAVCYRSPQPSPTSGNTEVITMIPYALRRAAFAAAILAPAALTSQAAPAITVGPNVQVSADRARLPHYEHLAGAHARDANKMMACAMVGDPSRGHDYSVVYTTVDGGKSWRHTLDA